MCKFKKIFFNIFLLFLFLVSTKIAFERSMVHIKKEKPSPWRKLEIHELDQNFLFALQKTKDQIEKAISVVKQKEEKEKLQHMNNKVKEIEKKYKRNSPTTFLLGPIGTTATVLKEEKLKKQLLEIINSLGNILHTLHKKKVDKPIEIASVKLGVAKNEKLISAIV